MTHYTLSYFDFHGGRGEDCRLALHLAGAEWTDDRVKGPDWPARKPKTPFGAMPVLEVSGRGTLAQSNAILAYLGRTFGLHPTDAFEAARHEMLMAAVEDLRSGMNPVLAIKEPAEKAAARGKLATETIPEWAGRMEACLGDGGPYVAGETLHVADLKIYVLAKWFASGSIDLVPADVLTPFARLWRIHETVKAHPGVVAYYEARKKR
jgi:glutathione S-transferase